MFHSDVRRMASALAHDVGKYVARTAHNVPESAWTSELASMLLRDLYDLRGERSLQAFLRLAPAASSPLAAYPEWIAAHDLLCDLDAMEPALRALDPTALHKAAQRALEVERLLHELSLRLRRVPARTPKGEGP